MPINGPASLAAYHQQILADERKPMNAATSFDTEAIVKQEAPSQPEPTQKKTRTTVAKLVQKYEERIDKLTDDIEESEKIQLTHLAHIANLKFRRSVWVEALAEINADQD